MTIDESRLPFYALLSPEDLRVYEAATARGLFNVQPAEEFWRDHYEMLYRRGYQLRPRYDPDWTPSWIGTRADPIFCEDSIALVNRDVMDATRREDGKLVCIKRIRSNEAEIDIALSLLTPDLIDHSMNHCVRILDAFKDSLQPETYLLVMPYLRPFDDPPFGAVGEVLDFVRQTLEGLCFIHSQNVAHRDCASENIMMDATPLYPHGHHPIRRSSTVDGIYNAHPLSRIDHPVNYYFIDFGISTRFALGESTMVVGAKGREKGLPELSRTVKYNALQADIFILGNLYKHSLLEKYSSLDFLTPLIASMTKLDPSARPTAPNALSQFHVIRSNLSPLISRWRLRPREESVPQRIVYDTVAVARETFHHLKKIVGQ